MHTGDRRRVSPLTHFPQTQQLTLILLQVVRFPAASGTLVAHSSCFPGALFTKKSVESVTSQSQRGTFVKLRGSDWLMVEALGLRVAHLKFSAII